MNGTDELERRLSSAGVRLTPELPDFAAAAGAAGVLDVAYATVISGRGGFAKLLGSGTASCPDLADDWRIHDAFWEHTGAEDFHRAYLQATAARSEKSKSLPKINASL